jgi:hypothetical protein
VSECVVQFFKIVYVDQTDRKFLRIAFATVQFFFEDVVHVPPVEDSGEPVDHCKLLRLLEYVLFYQQRRVHEVHEIGKVIDSCGVYADRPTDVFSQFFAVFENLFPMKDGLFFAELEVHEIGQ